MAWSMGLLGASLPSVSAGSFDLLQTEILASSQASVTFSDIATKYAGIYQHLQIRFVAKHSADQNGYMQFNGDAGSNYNWHQTVANGSTVTSFGTSDSWMQIAYGPNSTTAPTVGIIDILNPFNSSRYTTSRTLTGSASSTNNVKIMSGLWRNTAALTSIKLAEVGGSGSYKAGSRFSLYGLRAE